MSALPLLLEEVMAEDNTSVVAVFSEKVPKFRKVRASVGVKLHEEAVPSQDAFKSPQRRHRTFLRDEFRMKDFFDKLNEIDSIPIAMARWEMTGLDDEVRQMTSGQ